MTRKVLLLIAAALAAAFTSVSAQEGARTSPDNTPFYQGITDETSLTRIVEGRLARAQRMLDSLLAIKGRRTVENTLRPYNDIQTEIVNAEGPNEIAQTMHPDAKVMATAETLARRIALFRTSILLNRRVFDALSAIDRSGAPADARNYLSHELGQFRRQGVHKDEQTRARLLQLRDELAAAHQEFERNQQDPPALSSAENEDVRRRRYIENARVFDANLPVLHRILTLRHQVARLLGYSNWASYDFEDKVAATPENVAAFLDRAVAASAPRVRKEYGEILARKRADHPGADALMPWDVNYFWGLLQQERRSSADLTDPRPYLSYDRIRDGMLQVMGDLFGFRFVRVTSVPVWHPSVEVYEVFEGGERVARVYLDSHPRPLKAGVGRVDGSVRLGRRALRGRQLLELVQRTNVIPNPSFPGGVLAPNRLVVFFHEFGHVLHYLAAARQNWTWNIHEDTRTGGLARDFAEAPSQLLEEWVFDPGVMALVARHHETGAPIPASIVQWMRHFLQEDRGRATRQELIEGKVALSLHDRDPKDLDPIEVYREIAKAYFPVRLPEERYFPQRFSFVGREFNNASRYNYSWAQVVAKDFFTRFDRSNLLDPNIARHYKQTVLAPGPSRPAGDLIREFLGRPFNVTAWGRWLNEETR